MEITAVHIFFALLVIGLFLIGVEIFVPGGIVGILGGLALFGAVVAGFAAFPGPGGFIAAACIIMLVGVALVVWIKYFPDTRFGQKMMMSQHLASAKSADAKLAELVGKKGKSVSELRPAGFATIDGRRIDVVTRGEMISKNEEVEVIKVEGSRVIVTKAGEAK